jgi:drug/metabolite transporter (DMT)-like permease
MTRSISSSVSRSAKVSVVGDFYFQNSYTIPLNVEKNDDTLQDRDNNFKASIYVFFSYFLYSIVNMIGKIIGFYYPLVENSATNLVRGIIVSLICHYYFNKLGIELRKQFNKPYKTLLTLFVRCFFGGLCNFLLFESFKYMRISSSFTIFNTSPIFASILSVIFISGEITLYDALAFLICFLSVCMISKPSFLFSSEEDDGDTPFGISLSIIAAFFSGIAVFANKLLSKDFHYTISVYGMAMAFITISVVILPFTEYGFTTFSFPVFCWAILLSIIFYYSFGLFVHAMNIGDPVKILPITYTAIVLNLLYNTFIFGQPCDFWDILGSFLIIAVNVLKTFAQRGK